MKDIQLDDSLVSDMLCDPFYCIEMFAPYYAARHDVMVSEENWKKGALSFIKEASPEEFLDRLVENLKGNGSHTITKNKNG